MSNHHHGDGDPFDRLVHLINERFNQVMSAISDFNDKLTAFFARQDTAVSDLQGDIESLDKQIADLKAQIGGTITAEDQALLDAIVARVSGISDKLDALDAMTPPVTPPAAK